MAKATPLRALRRPADSHGHGRPTQLRRRACRTGNDLPQGFPCPSLSVVLGTLIGGTRPWCKPTSRRW